MVKSMHRTFIAYVFLGVLAIAAQADFASACPNCKDSIPMGASDNSGGGDPSAGLPGGFNTSIYVMLSAFVGVLGFVGFTLYRGVRGAPVSQGFEVAQETNHLNSH